LAKSGCRNSARTQLQQESGKRNKLVADFGFDKAVLRDGTVRLLKEPAGR
jgi:hypothetical protein